MTCLTAGIAELPVLKLDVLASLPGYTLMFVSLFCHAEQ